MCEKHAEFNQVSAITKFHGDLVSVFSLILHPLEKNLLFPFKVADVLQALADFFTNRYFGCLEVHVFIFEPNSRQHKLRKTHFFHCPLLASHLHAGVS